MRKSVILILLMAFVLFACQSKKEKSVQTEVESLIEQVEELPKGTTTPKKIFPIESAYVKYINHAAGQEMTREWWFDDYGNKQFEDNYLVIMGEKAGGNALIVDGFRYNWEYDNAEGTKMKYYSAPATDYENVPEKDKKRYGIEKHGYEDVAGKKCLKVTIEKPVKSTVWVWEGIPLKTISNFAGNDVLMEAVEIKTGGVDASLFEIPEDITFVDY
ncbi:MAG: DUF4412 domain-containing protein [Prolixibacteraceae bacterium]|nr:DUF4412 domain-containing protein [Prolixibacteraceae bacterium]